MAIQTLNTIKNWFKTSLKPTQQQFWDTWDSFRHKNEKLPIQDIENLEMTLNSKAEKSELDAHKINVSAHSELFNTKENIANKGIANGYAPLNGFTKLAAQYLDIINDLVSGGSNSLLSAEQGKILQNQINQIKTLLSSDNVNLNSLQKIVDTVEQIQLSLDTILVNDLISGGTTKALSAEMGKKLNEIKLTATIATDTETQILSAVAEDNKVISRSKLYNWWQWVKYSPLKWNNTISANPATQPNEVVILSQLNKSKPTLDDVLGAGMVANNKSIYLDEGDLEYRGFMSSRGFSASHGFSGIGMTSTDGIQFFINENNNGCTFLKEEKATQYNNLLLPNKSGKLAIIKDSVETAPGTKEIAPLIIPNGELTTVPQSGAIERDAFGNLYQTISNIRYRLLDTREYDNILMTTWKSKIPAYLLINTNKSNIVSKIVNIPATTFGATDFGSYTIKTVDHYEIESYREDGLYEPENFLFEVYLKGKNCKFSGNDSIRLYFSLINDCEALTRKIRNYEINLQTSLFESRKICSSLIFSDTGYDPLLNIISEEFNQYFIQSLTYSGTYGDMKLSEADISFEYRISIEYQDQKNSKEQNVTKVIKFNNLSTMVLKLQ
ncbi:hypothetical protein J0383_05165 [Flavobacterium endoglycinae]|uniref:Uncharacterized protein n=1 Tax=Flavobacterium endoglycinae TaxID=2816357 RepID=A0ABX7QHV1_9FLAO|nr:hypothetical protein [Flavobacterium endoglycinae]QSW90209.1 hypothetical protein J0383_05165 [Flavobacterium endoglycinae]